MSCNFQLKGRYLQTEVKSLHLCSYDFVLGVCTFIRIGRHVVNDSLKAEYLNIKIVVKNLNLQRKLMCSNKVCNS